MKQFFLALSVAVLLVGCGGGSDKKNSPANNPPPSSSAAAVSSSATSSAATSSAATSSLAVSSSVSSSKSTSTSSAVTTSSSVATTSSAQATSSIPFAFTSNGFTSGDKIPLKYSCFGSEISPQLQWDITSPAIKSFALIMEDYDAIALVGRPYVHWDVYNLPADTRQLAEGATLRAMPMGSSEGLNDDKLRKYSGPCPPEGTGTHHYFFALYALNVAELSIAPNKTFMRSDFETEYASAIIQKAEISGSYFYK